MTRRAPVRHPLAAAAGLSAVLLLPAAALADPVTYAGTLGKAAVVVEFTADPATAPEGVGARYFYRETGVDIPLQPAAEPGSGRIGLSEEAPCDREACPGNTGAPVAALWDLAPADGGATLAGEWKGPKPLPIVLKRVASRAATDEFPPTPLGLYQFSDQLSWFSDSGPIDAATSPYDALRFSHPLDAGEVREGDGAAYRLVTDPRTRFPFPQLVPADASTAAANRALEERHRELSIAALSCAALQYPGFTEAGVPRIYEAGTLGGFEDMDAVVTYRSPTVLDWYEAGSLWCGGAHPDNSTEYLTMEVRTGTLVTERDLLRDWTKTGPGAALAEFVKARRPKPTDAQTASFEAECGIDELIPTNLGLTFSQGEGGAVAVFVLKALPHAITVCGGDLLEMPVAEIRSFLTPRASALFPEGDRR